MQEDLLQRCEFMAQKTYGAIHELSKRDSQAEWPEDDCAKDDWRDYVNLPHYLQCETTDYFATVDSAGDIRGILAVIQPCCPRVELDTWSGEIRSTWDDCSEVRFITTEECNQIEDWFCGMFAGLRINGGI